MRMRFLVFAVVVLALSIVAGGCAKDKSPPQPQPAKRADAGTAEKAVPKPRAKLFTGTIEDLDEAAGTLTLKGPKGEMRFQARDKVKDRLDDLEIGDKVIVKHINETALSIVKPRTSNCVMAWKEKERI